MPVSASTHFKFCTANAGARPRRTACAHRVVAAHYCTMCYVCCGALCDVCCGVLWHNVVCGALDAHRRPLYCTCWCQPLQHCLLQAPIYCDVYRIIVNMKFTSLFQSFAGLALHFMKTTGQWHEIGMSQHDRTSVQLCLFVKAVL